MRVGVATSTVPQAGEKHVNGWNMSAAAVGLQSCVNKVGAACMFFCLPAPTCKNCDCNGDNVV